MTVCGIRQRLQFRNLGSSKAVPHFLALPALRAAGNLTGHGFAATHVAAGCTTRNFAAVAANRAKTVAKIPATAASAMARTLTGTWSHHSNLMAGGVQGRRGCCRLTGVGLRLPVRDVVPLEETTMPKNDNVLAFAQPTLAPSLPDPYALLPLRVLVIDDGADDRKFIRLALAAQDFIVNAAQNARAGIEAARALRPDCIVVDTHLSERDGVDVLLALRGLDDDMPCAVVIITESDTAAVGKKVLQAGALDYLAQQYVNEDSLRRAVRGAVERFKSQRERQLIDQLTAQLAAIVTKSDDAIISVTADDTILTWNPAAEKLFGYSDVEAIGRKTADLIVPRYLMPERTKIFAGVFAGQQAVVTEAVRRHKSGTLIPVEINASPMLADGRATAISVILRDLSERKRTEQRIADISTALSSTEVDGELSDELRETFTVITEGGAATRHAHVIKAVLFDAHPERAFDQITQLASSLLQAPVSLLTIIDKDRQFFVSSYGLPPPMQALRHKPLHTSYCRHVIESGEPVVIRDAETNPLVADIGAWRDGFVSYLGVPIRDETGVVIASLSVAGPIARNWTRQELLVLEGIATLLRRELETRAIARRLSATAAALRESDERLTFSLQAAAAGSWQWNIKSGEITWSAQNFVLYDLDAAQGVPKYEDWEARVHPDDRVRANQAVQDALNNITEQFRLEFRVVHRDEKVQWLLGAGSVERDADGAPLRLSGINIDITEKKFAEDELRAARDSFRSLVDHSPFGIYAVDADFRFVQASIGAQKSFAPEEVIGRDFSEVTRSIWSEPFASEVIGRFRQVLATGVPYHALSTSEQRADSGNVESYDWQIERVILPDGRPGVICHFYDLSERQRFENALRASETRFRNVFENASTGIVISEPNGRLVQFNPAFCKLVGYTPLELASEIFPSLVHPEDRAENVALWKALMSGERASFELENRFVHKLGHPVWVRKYGFCVPGSGDKPPQVVALITDTTESRKREAHIKLLMNEVNHRSKNLLGVVQAIAKQTIASTPEIFAQRFSERIKALAASQDLLVRDGWSGAPLDELLRSQLSHFKDLIDQRIHLDGPMVRVSSASAQTIGMAVHELATNAGKYGALSNDEGHVEISWQVVPGTDGDRFTLSWRERDGPPVPAPTRSGFGSTVISTMVRMGLNAVVKLDYASTGFVWHLDCPATSVLET